MGMDERIKELFQSVDNRDVNAFLGFLSDDVRFRFGNAPPVDGKANVGNLVSGFLESVKSLRHDVVEIWQKQDVVVCHGVVTYTRKDSSTLSVPFANIFKLAGVSIREYLIFVDISELYK